MLSSEADNTLSWGAEFEADRAATQAYGTSTFINAMTGVGVANNTVRNSRSDLRQDMARHNNPNFYAELRRYYKELPPEYIVQLRLKAVRDYRSLDGVHPSISDSLRFAVSLNAPTPPLAPAPCPAYELLTPAGGSDASRAEIEVTRVLFSGSGKLRR